MHTLNMEWSIRACEHKSGIQKVSMKVSHSDWEKNITVKIEDMKRFSSVVENVCRCIAPGLVTEPGLVVACSCWFTEPDLIIAIVKK